MAKRIKPGTQFGIAPKKVNDHVDEILALHKRIRKASAENANRIGKIKENINDVYAAAQGAGIDKAALKLQVDKELAKMKLDEREKALDPTQLDMFHYVQQARGDTDEPAPTKAKAANGAAKPPKPPSESVKAAADRAEAGTNVTQLRAP
jgi:hypothetical protein